jgi:urocanate hydratase
MLMIQNNLDYAAQHPHELITTYGETELFFQKLAQYSLSMKYPVGNESKH